MTSVKGEKTALRVQHINYGQVQYNACGSMHTPAWVQANRRTVVDLMIT